MSMGSDVTLFLLPSHSYLAFAPFFLHFFNSTRSSACRFRGLLRMLSTGEVRWRLWAPLVVLALVSCYPNRAQSEGKSSSSLVHFHPVCHPSSSQSTSPL